MPPPGRVQAEYVAVQGGAWQRLEHRAVRGGRVTSARWQRLPASAAAAAARPAPEAASRRRSPTTPGRTPEGRLPGRRPAARSCRAGCLTPPRLESRPGATRSEEHTSELQSLMRISYAVFCLKKKNQKK